MTERKALRLQILSIAIILLIAFSMGTAQTREEQIRQMYIDNIVRLTIEALNDSCVNIALCEVPTDPYIHEEPELISDSGGVKHYTASLPPDLLKIKIKGPLRTNVEMDTLIFLSESYGIMWEGAYWQFPSVYLRPNSKWIMFLDSPFFMSRWYHSEVMEKTGEYERQLKGQVNLSPNNYFTLYQWDSGALCTYFPEDAKYPPMFIYSEDLVDDFRIILDLQENPSALLESSKSYDKYYSLIKDDFGKRLFTELFDSKRDIVEMVANALNDSSISIVLGKKLSHAWFTVSDSGEAIDGLGRYIKQLSLIGIWCEEILRGNISPGSTINTSWLTPGNEDRNTVYLSLLIHNSKPECVFLLESPYRKRNSYQVSLLKLYEKYVKSPPLNPNNFFSLYQLGTGALPVGVPENHNYPPEIIYSKELVSDLKTIIKLQKDPLLLLETRDSYENYYKSLKDNLGRRVFSRLFGKIDQ